jgi:2-polyprenyl-3-methyl-5-hydroxy-6-metoxy-1,4-benzoquinol methylase
MCSKASLIRFLAKGVSRRSRFEPQAKKIMNNTLPQSQWKKEKSLASAIDGVRGYGWPTNDSLAKERAEQADASRDAARWTKIRASFLRDGQLPVALPQEWISYVCHLAQDAAWMHYYLWEAYQVLELFGQKRLDGMKILEPGCGAGVIGGLFALMGAEVTLFDNDSKTLTRAREHSDALGVTSRINFVEGDMFHSPLPKRSFDLVWNDGTIEHFDDPVTVVQLMASMAKPGGRVLVTVPNKWTAHTFVIRPLWRWRNAYTHDRWGKEKSYSETELRHLLEGAGLSDVRTATHHLRRAFVDDRLRILQILTRLCKPAVAAIVNALDAVESTVPGIRKLGFMVGGVGTVRASEDSQSIRLWREAA